MVRPTEKAKTSIRIRAFFETGKDDTEEALYLLYPKARALLFGSRS